MSLLDGADSSTKSTVYNLQSKAAYIRMSQRSYPQSLSLKVSGEDQMPSARVSSLNPKEVVQIYILYLISI